MSLVDGLKQLPSCKFYEVFADLRTTIDGFKTKWALDQLSQTDPAESEEEEENIEVDDSVSQKEPIDEVGARSDPAFPDRIRCCVF
ncbi:hypothetical protein PC128_g6089 [Phytophthora cactorum]|nr:hypothetical protein PC128_g6089 [Phytophthora cactorum]KAG4062018.1 hypothetical protein PC123_g3133 [Phytophthora cactorum]